MPIYFIDTTVGKSHVPDRVGSKFDDKDAATRVAFAALLDIAQDEGESFAALSVSIAVRDSSENVIYSATLKSAESTFQELGLRRVR